MKQWISDCLSRFREDPWKMLPRYLMAVSCLSLLFTGGLFFSLSKVRKLPVQLVHTATTVNFSIDSVEEKSGVSLKISGWALERGKDIIWPTNTVVLSGKSGTYVLPTKLVYRKDLEQAFAADGRKYERAGFFARALRVSLPDGTYRIFIRYKTNETEQFVDSGRTVRL